MVGRRGTWSLAWNRYAWVIVAVVLGVALGSFQAINSAVYAHYFGRKHAGEIRGATFVITILGAALGPLPFGWSSSQGGYSVVLVAGGYLVCPRGDRQSGGQTSTTEAAGDKPATVN